MKTENICPACKATLSFDRALNSVVKCPNCKFTGKVETFKEKEPETEAPGNPSKGKIYKPGKLEFVKSDVEWLSKEKIVDLKRGVNTLGRQSGDSKATIQLPVIDPYMSRVHATIDVVMKADGVFEHRLSSMKSKNGTFHNGELLADSDVIKLLPGETIRLGHTFFRFIVE